MEATESRSRPRVLLAHRQIHFIRSEDDLAATVVEDVARALEEAASRRGIATLALCGGSGAARVLELLAREPYVSRLGNLWRRIHVFWTEERHVSPDHPDSHYRRAHRSLLDRIAIPSVNVHRIRAEMPDAGDAAAAYHQELRRFFVTSHLTREGLPCFDLVLVAEDVAVEEDGGRWAVARWTAGRTRYDIGLTLPVLRNARRAIVFLADGDAAEAGRRASLLRFVA